MAHFSKLLQQPNTFPIVNGALLFTSFRNKKFQVYPNLATVSDRDGMNGSNGGRSGGSSETTPLPWRSNQ